MKFEHSFILNFLWFVPLLGIFLFWMGTYRQKISEQFIETKLFESIAENFDHSRLVLKNVFLIFVVTFSIIALCRPQWGFVWQEVKRQGIDILVVVDTSRSMLTQDVKPNRLERTKLAVKDLIKKLKGDRIGLIAFSGDAFLVCPLTVDYDGFILSLNDLNTDTVPRGGTNLSKAIEEAIKGYDKTPNKYKAIIVVTDGDDLEGNPVELAKKAAKNDIKIYCIGIGTREGELIQIRNERGEKEFLKDNNSNFVKSRLNEKLLQEIALTANGMYIKASGAEFGLDLIYEQELTKFEKRDIESKMEKKYYDRFQIPLSLATFLLLLETCLGTRKRKK